MSWGFGPWGISEWGTTAEMVIAAEEARPTVHGLPIKLTIHGADLTDTLMNDSVTIKDEVNSRNSFEFTLRDDSFMLDVRVGMVVNFTIRNTFLFSGTVDEIQSEIPADVAATKFLNVTCIDWNQLADRHLVTNRYKAMTLRDVVKAIVNTDSGDLGETLASEGVTATDDNIQEGPILDNVAFKYDTVADAFDELSNLSGFAWNIDYNRQLKFFDKLTNPAPYEIDSTTWVNIRNVQLRQNREEYRNVQILKAGKGMTSDRTDEFVGDGKNRTFTLRMPIAEKPEVWLKIGAGVLTQVDPTKVDIQPDDDLKKEEVEWFYRLGDKDVIQNAAALYTPLAAADTLRVIYKGEYPLQLQARNDIEVAARKAIEGGTGIYCEVEESENVDSDDMAVEKAERLLSKYSVCPSNLSYETDFEGFKSGQWLNVNLPEFGICGKFFIKNMSFRYTGDSFFRYQINAIDSNVLDSWVSFYKRLASNGRPMLYNENDILLLSRHAIQSVIVGDSVSLTEDAELPTSDVVSRWRFGSWRVGGVRGTTALLWDNAAGVVYGATIGLPR
jgi:hypothetical protein